MIALCCEDYSVFDVMSRAVAETAPDLTADVR
jgi:hypothetical protein